jgi:Tetracyclin repressor-like, C-terminal domain
MEILREGGFSVDLTHHAIHVMGSRIFGFTQDPWDQSGGTAPTPEVSAILAREMSARYPYVTEMAMAVSHDGGLGGCDDDVEFEFGLDLILDGLERLRDAA